MKKTVFEDVNNVTMESHYDDQGMPVIQITKFINGNFEDGIIYQFDDEDEVKSFITHLQLLIQS